MATLSDLLIDPDCRAGKCSSCVGDPCEHWCHTNGVSLIKAERKRQIEVLGYSGAHDAHCHQRSELAMAAAVLAMPAVRRHTYWVSTTWPAHWDPPKRVSAEPYGRLEELVKAGALIAAEIDRLLDLDAYADYKPRHIVTDTKEAL